MDHAAFLEALLQLPAIYGATLSPDHQWVAWTWFRTAPTAEVYIAPTDGSAAPTRLTDTPENTFFVSWTPDSRAVIVEEDKNGNERARLFRVALDNPVMEALTEDDPHYFLRGGDLHPNGTWLFYGANYDVAAGTEIEPTYLYRHDLGTDERTLLAKPEKGGFVIPSLSPDGNYVLYNRMDLHPSGMQVWLVDSDGAHDREILNFGTEVKTYGGWYSDSQQVVFLTETPTHKKLGIWSLDSGEVRWLIDDPLRNLEHAFVPHNSAEIVIYEVQDARTQSSLLNPITGSERKITLPSGNFNLIGTLENGDCIGVLYSAQQPTDIVRFSPDAPEQITSISRVWSRTALTGNDFAKAENFRWSSVDDMAIHGWLYRAKGEPKGTIVYVHGGPTAHSTDQINNQIQFFVRAGFNVLDPNYRGSTGYHQPFKEAIKVDGWGGREQDDIATGVQALIDAGIAQPGRVGITGTSYGGYSSWCAITRFPPELFAASAPVCGMTDLVVDYETTRPDLRPYSEEMLGGRPDQIPQKYHERSPINYVQNIKGRLLIVQGLQDPNVTPENVRTVTAALQTAHVEYGLLVFEDEGHGIIKPKNQGMLYQRLLDFFETM